MAAERTDWESGITNIAYIHFDRDIYIFSINQTAVWPIPNIAFFKTEGHNKGHEHLKDTLLPMLGSIPRSGPFKHPKYELINKSQGLEPNFIIKCSSIREFRHDTTQRPRWQCDIYTAYFQTLHPDAFRILNLKVGNDFPQLSEHGISVCELMISEIRRLDTLFSYFLFDWQLKISIRASGGFWHDELGRKFIGWYRETYPIGGRIHLKPDLTPINKDDTLYTLLDTTYDAQITNSVFGNLLELTPDGFFVEINRSLRTQIFSGQTQLDQQRHAIRRIQERQEEEEQYQERQRKKRSTSAAEAEVGPPNRPALNGGKYTKKNKRSKMSRNKKYKSKNKKSKRCKLKKCNLAHAS
jgi:hypothetical protein